jgi:hypothetical protein
MANLTLLNGEMNHILGSKDSRQFADGFIPAFSYAAHLYADEQFPTNLSSR